MQHYHSISQLTFHDNLPLLDEGFDDEGLDAMGDSDVVAFVHPESHDEEE